MSSGYQSQDLKNAILSHYHNGLPYSWIVAKINVCSGFKPITESFVLYQVKEYHESNSVENRPKL